ncbi:MAG: type II secretion system F family protein [Pirellulales bacterium]|nr:type II secretion system F family protein [Pirellulales bacterium]
MFSARMTIKELLQLCRRLATSVEAGIDMRSIWKREAAGAGRGSVLRRYAMIRDAVAQGESLSKAVAACDDFFPPLFGEMVEVGEQTGQLGRVFGQLAEHYQGQLTRWRAFLAAITWPMIQLVASICIIGFVIWIVGVIAGPNGAIDILGLGLVGNSGLAVYVIIVSGLGIGLVFLIQVIRRGLLQAAWLERAVLKVPGLGPALVTLALARLAWALHLTLNTGMDVRRALGLSLRSTHCIRFLDQIHSIDAALASGDTIYEAFAATGVFPSDFLDAMHVGEQTGNLVESMGGLSVQYQERAKLALATLMTLAGWAVWALIAAIIIFFIIRLAFFYIGILNRAGAGVF